MNNSLERYTHLLLQRTADCCLKRLLSLNLLVENSEGYILKVCNGGDLLVKKDFLGDNVDQESVLVIMAFLLYFNIIDLFWNNLSKWNFCLLV